MVESCCPSIFSIYNKRCNALLMRGGMDSGLKRDRNKKINCLLHIARACCYYQYWISSVMVHCHSCTLMKLMAHTRVQEMLISWKASLAVPWREVWNWLMSHVCGGLLPNLEASHSQLLLLLLCMTDCEQVLITNRWDHWAYKWAWCNTFIHTTSCSSNMDCNFRDI